MRELMKKVILNVESAKYEFFLELIQSLDFVQLHNRRDSENSKEQVLQSITQSLKELEQYKVGKIKGIPAKELLDEI